MNAMTSEANKKNMLIIDGNSILNRAFFGMPALTNSRGADTGALYGMMTIILPKLEQLSPLYAAVAYDLKAPTFRHKLFDEYKADRKPMPPELFAQLPVSKALMSELGLYVCELEGYEADDLLGTMASMGESAGVHVYLLTGDRDALQLISENVTVLLATTGQTQEMTPEAFFEKYKTAPPHLVDLKALMGDSSDNIPGVPGIGEKTAIKLISEFGSLDGVYEAIDSEQKLPVGPAALTKLREGREKAYLSYRLAEICRTAPMVETLDSLKYKGYGEGLLPLMRELEFDRLISRLGITENAPGNVVPEYTSATADDIAPLASEASGKTVSLWQAEDGCYIRCGDRRLHISPCSVDTLAPLLGSAAVISVNDSKELDKEAIRCGIEINAELFDISLAAYVLSPGDSAPSLTHIASAFGNFTIPESDGTPLPEYCAEALYELVPALQKQLADSDQEQIYYKIELPLARVLAQMEHSGFKVDIPGLREYGDELLEAQKNAESEIYTLAGGEFNIASPKQLGTVLFEKLGLPALKKTKSGYSTSADVLEKLRPYSPIIDLIFDYRRAAKLHSTYAVGLVNAADTDGIIHSSFKQNVTATGRLSSAEPNLQNIPIRTELGRRFRRYFIPRRENSVLIDADYSQIELRILAHMSGDTAMTDAFLSGEDIHTVTASQVFGVPLDAVTPELRKRAKAVNFGIVYGIGDFSLAADIGVTKREAKAYIESYLEKYSGIREFMSGAKEQARREGYVMTLYGRRRYIPEISSPRAPLRAFGERVAMNSPIQGTAADIIKIAMINTSRALRKAGLDARLILQVHDELIVECAERDKEQAAKILRDCMENAAKLTVPLTVDLHWGRSWEECK